MIPLARWADLAPFQIFSHARQIIEPFVQLHVLYYNSSYILFLSNILLRFPIRVAEIFVFPDLCSHMALRLRFQDLGNSAQCYGILFGGPVCEGLSVVHWTSDVWLWK